LETFLTGGFRRWSRKERGCSLRGNTVIHGAGVQPGVFRHEAHRANLASITGHDIDVDDATHTDHHIATQTYRAGLQHAVLDCVARYVDAVPNDHVVAEVQKVVVGDGKTIHVHAPA
jgi:hypothetical protein